ncbi:hypothetical protein TI04_07810 [Achromatium sp. WMS2]|nr:hypothetical protein TI04_07810 [Achromatium sp. WMS2]
MRALRWKSQYAKGEQSSVKRGKELVGCFNQLLSAAAKREHCQEMNQFLMDVSTEIDDHLRQPETSLEQVTVDFYQRIVDGLPLKPYGSSACRNCGLCSLAQQKVAEHLQQPLVCLKDNVKTENN